MEFEWGRGITDESYRMEEAVVLTPRRRPLELLEEELLVAFVSMDDGETMCELLFFSFNNSTWLGSKGARSYGTVD